MQPRLAQVSPAGLLSRELRRDGSRPLVTWYDDATGERVELSVATAANWAAKVAGLLVDEWEIGPGHAVGVALPVHWETVVVLLGIWSAGAAAVLDGAGSVTFTTRESAQTAGTQIVLGLAPLGGDFGQLVATQPDVFVPPIPVNPTKPALVVAGHAWSHAQLVEAAADAARAHGLDAHSRVLSTMAFDGADGLDASLLAPLAAGGSVVLVSNADGARLADRCASERVTHTAGVGVPGLPRLDPASR